MMFHPCAKQSFKKKIGRTRNNGGRMARKEDQKRGLGDYYDCNTEMRMAHI